MSQLQLFGQTHDAWALVGTLGLGVVGGLAAKAIGLPLPWLSGALIFVAIGAMAGVTIRQAPLQFPHKLRIFFVPIIGVAIGSAFTPALIEEATRWWPTLLALLVYVPLAHAMSYAIYRNYGGLDQPTAFFAATPGGLIEAIAMGEAQGAKPALLTLLQFARLMFCILLVPLSFMAIEGMAVGSAAGVEIEAATASLGFFDVLVLTSCGVIGLLGAQRLRVPAAMITGPILLSGVAHVSGLTAAAPPGWMISATQLVIGVSLGSRFVGETLATALFALKLAGVSVISTLAVAAVFGFIFAGFVGETVEAVVLAFAPGGVVEMSLVAVSLEISVFYVVAHHVLRIVLSVVFAAIGYRLIRPPETPANG